MRLFGILYIQRDQKDEGFAAFASSEREAATVFAEVRADLRSNNEGNNSLPKYDLDKVLECDNKACAHGVRRK